MSYYKKLTSDDSIEICNQVHALTIRNTDDDPRSMLQKLEWLRHVDYILGCRYYETDFTRIPTFLYARDWDYVGSTLKLIEVKRSIFMQYLEDTPQ